MQEEDFNGTDRVVLPKNYFDRPQVYLGGAMEGVEVEDRLELDGLVPPLYSRTTTWIALILAGCLVPMAAA